MNVSVSQGIDTLRLLIDNVQEYAIFLLDESGHILSWNAGARRIKGYTAQEIIGKHFSIFYPREDTERGKPEMALRVAMAAAFSNGSRCTCAAAGVLI